MIARRLEVSQIHVARVNLRDGLIKEMMTGRQWVGNAHEQVIDSALALARRFAIDEAHARHVAFLAVELFRQTAALHQLPERWEIDLHLAALLHEVGLAISERSYHKHSQYIIRHSVFFGVSTRELNLIALIARYHRRALPQRTHEIYSQLDQDDRVAVSKLAALLRIAKALDAGRNQSIQEIRAERIGNSLQVSAAGLADVSIEQLELRRQQELFEYVFGLNVELLSATLAGVAQ
jgi:exopolyphosphatase/guanosine-5'-triphosphate,3'-diphosphate pyrophosphatase